MLLSQNLSSLIGVLAARNPFLLSLSDSVVCCFCAGVDETELEKEISEETKAKLAETVKATGKSGGFFGMKFKAFFGSDPKEKAKKEVSFHFK